MSVLDGFENTKRVVEEKLCAKLVFEGIEIDISRRLIYRGKPIYIQTVWGVGYRFNKNLSNSL